MSTLGGRSADTAIGGVFPIAHLVPTARAGDGVELDLAVGVFTRFDRRYSLAVADYLVRIPVTWTHGRTWLQAAFAHRSSHLGDDALKASGAVTTTRARDELELSGGLDISPRLRALARAAVIVNSKGMPPGRGRAGLGLEWRPTSDGPFAAIDVDERSWHNWVAGVTVRSGWQWRRASGRTLRLALEGYNGRSPFGQALEDKEEWLAATFDLDW